MRSPRRPQRGTSGGRLRPECCGPSHDVIEADALVDEEVALAGGELDAPQHCIRCGELMGPEELTLGIGYALLTSECSRCGWTWNQ